jgi:hypothetical protein
MEDPDNLDRFPPFENDNHRPRPVYDPMGRPKIIIGDVARPASNAKHVLAVPVASMLIMFVALVTVVVWVMLAKVMP